MNVKQIAAILLLVAAVLAVLFMLTPQEEQGAILAKNQSLKILELGRAGDYGYATVDLSGVANLTMLGYKSQPLRRVVVLNDTDAMEGYAAPFADDLGSLERYGFTVAISERKALADGSIYVVPSGAIPSYVYDDLKFNVTDAIVVYIGKPDLVYRGGVRQEEWYSSLDARQQGRVVLYDTTPDEFLEQNRSLVNDILMNAWAVGERSDMNLTYNGRRTYSFVMNDTEYVRLIASIGDKVALVDSQRLRRPATEVNVSPQSIFPWEKANLTFALNRSNGTASLTISKDGVEEYRKELGRVRDATYFPERISLDAPGDHIIRIVDNAGTLGGTVVHVKDLNVSYIGSSGVSYLFNVTVDGVPVNNEQAKVHLGNSTQSKDFFVSNGVLSVPAQLQQGDNVFVISILGTEQMPMVSYSQEGLGDVYIKYGIPGLLLVIVVYFGARMTRRPVYVLRVGETAGEIRKDVRLPAETALSLVKSARKELGIGASPITAHEFAIALKRHVTEGADITEGNVEEILQRLAKKGFLESHRQYYQLKGEGDIRRNAMVRIIRDKLIQAGVQFRSRGRHFVTDRMEIGFFGEKFSRSGVAVIEDQQEMDAIFSQMAPEELAELRIRMANGTFRFVTLDKLDEIL